MSNGESFISHIEFLKSQINNRLRKTVSSNEPKYLYEPIKYIIRNSGKRLRPILVFLSGQLCKTDPDDLMKAAIAVELMHNFTLVHDDIMDNDSIRHGKIATHEKWDISSAILSGDAIFTISQLMLKDLPRKAHIRFNEVALSVCEGQALDKEFENDQSITLDKYIYMISQKTGALLGLCAEFGPLLAKKNPSEINEFFLFGSNLGLAFQIQDDYLEIFGNSKMMGKSLGSDLDSGKQTAMTILAREKNSKDWNRLIRNGADLNSFKNFFIDNDVEKDIKRLINKYISETNSSISSYNLKERFQLEEFSRLILNRRY